MEARARKRVGNVRPVHLCALGVDEVRCFKYIVRPPHGPHAGREVWIEVAMENRVAHHLVPVAASVVDHLKRVAGSGTNHLTVEIAGLVTVGRLQPLMRMLVMYVRDVPATVKNSKLHVIVDVAVIDVGWIIRVISPRCFEKRSQRVRETSGRWLRFPKQRGLITRMIHPTSITATSTIT